MDGSITIIVRDVPSKELFMIYLHMLFVFMMRWALQRSKMTIIIYFNVVMINIISALLLSYPIVMGWYPKFMQLLTCWNHFKANHYFFPHFECFMCLSFILLILLASFVTVDPAGPVFWNKSFCSSFFVICNFLLNFMMARLDRRRSGAINR